MKLFTATIDAGNERCVDLPGFSHWGQPREYGPRMVRTIYFFAKNRTQAGNHLGRYVGISGPCDLSGGETRRTLLTTSMIARIEASK